MYRLSRRRFLRIAGATTTLLGISLMLVPAPIVTYFSGGVMPSNVHFVRFLGAALLGYSVLNWQGSWLTDRAAIRTVLLANLASLSLASLIDILALIKGELNPHGWLILSLHLIFWSGFSFYLGNHSRSVA